MDEETKSYSSETNSHYSEVDSDFAEMNIEEEEELFHDANEMIVRQEVIKASADVNKYQILDIAEERLTLPHLRPANQKVSIFKVLKDLIGKDLTKVSLPVYFNEPLSIV
jgi:hypothetical protein